MITTTADMYRAFLDGIKKSETSIVKPSQFNRIINQWGQDEYLRTNAMEIELNQKKIENLEKIRVATDGIYTFNGTTIYPIAPLSDNVFEIPKYNFSINAIINGLVEVRTYPRYLRLLNVMFKLTYGAGQECSLTGVSDWLQAYIMRSDQRSVILDNPFRKPKDSRLYYEIIDGKVRLITGTTSVGYAMRLEYLRYPVEIFFNENNVPDTGIPATGSVMCEFGPQQAQEIVEIAVRTYLERVKDPRYQSFLNEEIIKASSK